MTKKPFIFMVKDGKITSEAAVATNELRPLDIDDLARGDRAMPVEGNIAIPRACAIPNQTLCLTPLNSMGVRI